MIGTIILFLVVLSVLVLAHEWGHYFTAKKIGAKVEEFGLGFPPKVFSWTGKDGMTWSLNAIPIGGFVRIKGENHEDGEDDDSFAKKPILARLLVLAAGVIMNMVVAAVLFSITALVGMPAVTEGDVPAAARVRDTEVRMMQVLPDSPAGEVFEPGDTLVEINGEAVTSSPQGRELAAAIPEGSVAMFRVQRSGEEMTFEVSPETLEETGSSGFGFALVETGIVSYPVYLAPVKGIETTWIFTRDILVAFYELIRGLFVGEPSVQGELSGPIGIAVMTGEVAEMGIPYLLQFAALLSINLAILNILPIPALDGGRIAFVLIEAVIGRPVSPRFEAALHNLGFVLLMILVVFVTYKDIANLI